MMGAVRSEVPAGTIGILDGDVALMTTDDDPCDSLLPGERLFVLTATGGGFWPGRMGFAATNNRHSCFHTVNHIRLLWLLKVTLSISRFPVPRFIENIQC